MTRWLLLLPIAIGLAACGDDGGAPAIDARDPDGGDPIDAAIDAASAAPIEAPAETWTWVPIAGMTCGNGSATGVGVNLTTRSDRVLVFLVGGGACWDNQTCFVLHTAANIDTDYGAAQFQQQLANLAAYRLFSRAAGAPFADASFVFVPYCTGDLHAGHQVTTYSGGTVHHVGQDNLDALWPRLRATRPSADVVWLTGASAGGYGAMLQQGRARAAWPSARFHALSDSSQPVDPEASRWTAIRSAWSLDLPAGCAACGNGLGGWPGHLRATMPAGSRWALLMSTQDQVIAQYMGFTGPQLEAATLAIRDGMAPGTGQGAFVIAGTGHVLTTMPSVPTTAGGVSLATWIGDFASGAATWGSTGP